MNRLKTTISCEVMKGKPEIITMTPFKQTIPDKSDTEPPTKPKKILAEKQKVIMMFYIMTRTDLLAFSSNQTRETWTSSHPLKSKSKLKCKTNLTMMMSNL